jgi:hypothetical protein
MKTTKSKSSSAPTCVFCGRSAGVQFNIFTPRFKPFGTACVECEESLPPGTEVPTTISKKAAAVKPLAPVIEERAMPEKSGPLFLLAPVREALRVVLDFMSEHESATEKQIALLTPLLDPDTVRNRSTDALDKIQALLDGKEWNGAETLGDIAEIIRGTGRTVNDEE